ncbi:spry domain containing socs box protein [Anaeramoeba flamelloides]|uniref:Spry domain containing socs box protein n=1 Tax=Anaeramoeba flamelloides TaxID=1746091 RepID=A0AAV7Y5N0_9EUKA|nr:spry domain containing socs box protein [Anaeramoeba flamelloides]KAJ6250494.1 spry domain containing socs box protein [Anaeramoeba flamelloides]|eukprot:Anaeramoba_flamelloidesa1058647_193.p1 GENE.a1058647_193~~a1058647_193.p1  ORF type:complete len:179 (+),score=39.64 a1058647_193:163-699(+)
MTENEADNFDNIEHVNETWGTDKKGNGVEISNNKRTLRQTVSTTNSSGNTTCRGSTLMDQNRIYKFKVKVDTRGYGYVAVGIVLASSGMGEAKTISWSFDCYGSTKKISPNTGWVSYGTNVNAGDTITVIVDKSAGTLEFEVNDISQGVAFNNLPNEEFVFFTELSGNTGCQVSLCDF